MQIESWDFYSSCTEERNPQKTCFVSARLFVPSAEMVSIKFTAVVSRVPPRLAKRYGQKIDVRAKKKTPFDNPHYCVSSLRWTCRWRFTFIRADRYGFHQCFVNVYRCKECMRSPPRGSLGRQRSKMSAPRFIYPAAPALTPRPHGHNTRLKMLFCAGLVAQYTSTDNPVTETGKCMGKHGEARFLYVFRHAQLLWMVTTLNVGST